MTTLSTAPRPTSAGPRFELMLAILGAVSSAVVTWVLDELEVSTTGKLIGLALGAALPPFVAVAGPRHHLRVAAAVLLTGAAVVLAYSGWQIFAKVSGTQPVLPPPGEIVADLGGSASGSGGSGGGEDTTGDALVMTEGALQISVSPPAITCGADGDCDAVTVTSTGSATLHITSIEVEGDSAAYLTATGCPDAVLEHDESCTITLTFAAGDAPEPASTHLVIHQNFLGPATFVPLEVHGTPPALPNLALAGASCEFSGTDPDPDTGEVSGVLTVTAPMSSAGSLEGVAVEAIVYVDGAVRWTSVVDVGSGVVSAPVDYAGPPPEDVVVALDPANQIEESSEEDNAARCA